MPKENEFFAAGSFLVSTSTPEQPRSISCSLLQYSICFIGAPDTGSQKAHEWDGSFSSRDLSSHIFCGSASYFVTRRLSLPCHSTLICIAAAAHGRAVGLSLILVDSFCCTAPADLHFYTDQQYFFMNILFIPSSQSHFCLLKM